MGKYVHQEMVISPWTVPNGADLRPCHPDTVDRGQQHIMAGLPWAVPTVCDVSKAFTKMSPYTPGYVPLILRPWQEFIVLAVRAVCTETDGTVAIALMELGGGGTPVALGLNSIALTQAELSVQAAPTTLPGWQQVPWYGVGALGSSAPAGSGKGCIQLTPVNAWQTAWLEVDVSHAVVHDIAVRTYCSTQPLA